MLNLKFLQARDVAKGYCQVGAKKSSDDRGRVERHWSSAEPWLGALHASQSRYLFLNVYFISYVSNFVLLASML